MVNTLKYTWLFCFFLVCTGAIAQPAIGDRINPDFKSWKPVSKRFSPGKYTVLDFWASWCDPCIASFPVLERIQQKYSDKLTVVALSNEDVPIISRFVHTKKYPGLIFASDTSGNTFDQFEVLRIPVTFLLSPDGELLWAGDAELLVQQLPSILENIPVPIPEDGPYIRYYIPKEQNEGRTDKQTILSIDISYAKPGDRYLAGRNIDLQKAMLTYRNTAITEIAEDLIGINPNRIIHERKDFNNIFLDLDVKANSDYPNTDKLYNNVLEYLKMSFHFSVRTIQRRGYGYVLSKNSHVLNRYKESIRGDGSVQREQDSIFFYRMSLQQIGQYLEKKRGQYIQLAGSEMDSESNKYSMAVRGYNDFER